MKKIMVGITILFLLLGVAYATDIVDMFKAPSSLQPMGTNSFVDGQGHNIQIMEYNDGSREIWFENGEDYVVQPYENNNSFYSYVEGSDVDPDGIEDIGIVELVEKDNAKYIISSWTPNDGEDEKVIFDNLVEFNKLNNLEPISV